MVHVPALPAGPIVTVFPETVQMPGVLALNVTACPEDAMAETVNGGSVSCLFASGSNVIVCAAGLTTCDNAAEVLARVVEFPT